MIGGGDAWKCYWENKIFKQSAENKTIWYEYYNDNQHSYSFDFIDKNQSQVRILKQDGLRITLTSTAASGIDHNSNYLFICEGTWQKSIGKSKLENF